MNLKEAIHQAIINRRLIKRLAWDTFMKISPKADYMNITIADAVATDWVTVMMDKEPTTVRADKEPAVGRTDKESVQPKQEKGV